MEELWAQGYSEPGAGSDLANVQTRARRDGDDWVLDGQKVWTSNAHFSQWLFVIARSEPGSERHHGLSFLLVPIDQDGVEVRPIEQLTGGSEFNEVFLTGARTPADLVVGEPGDGWRVAMGLLGFERGVSILAQLVGFTRELEGVVALAKETGAIDDAVLRDRLAALKVELEVMRFTALRSLSAVTAGEDSSAAGGAASIFKLVWANWHKRLGEVAMDVRGLDGLLARPPGERRRTSSTTGSGSSSSRARTPSTAAATRCSATSWPSGCSACPASPREQARNDPEMTPS